MAKIPQTINSPLLKVWGFHFGLQFCEQYTQYTVNYRKEKGRRLGIGRKSLNRASYFLCAKKTNKKKKKTILLVCGLVLLKKATFQNMSETKYVFIYQIQNIFIFRKQ